MELFFIRHGQGEHTINLPESLHKSDPALTKEGIVQAESLRQQISLTENDLVVASPTRRTLQTADILSENINCRKIVCPLVSPRIFPPNPELETLRCDRMLQPEIISEEFPGFHMDKEIPPDVRTEGINTLPDSEFNVLAEYFIKWCKQQGNKKIYIVSHDGTITSYRQFISGKKLSREDFPIETGWIKVELQ